MASSSRGVAGAVVVVLLLLLAVAGYSGSQWGGPIVSRVQGWIGSSDAAPSHAPPTAELAEETIRRVELFRSSEEAGELPLGATQLASVVRFAVPGMIPEGVSSPEILLTGERVRVSARVERSAFAAISELERVLGLLPESFPMELEGTVQPIDGEGAALVVSRIRAAGVPLPSGAVPLILEKLGREERAGLPPEAMPLPLPRGLRSAYIRSDSLILVAARP